MQPDMSVWQGRVDDEPNALRWHQKVQAWSQDAAPGVVLVGFACDEGVRRNQGRPGAAAGPMAIRRALANLAWHQARPVYDAGDLTCTKGDLERAQEDLADCLSGVIRSGHFPLILGGGHETAWGTFTGLARSRHKSSIGIINLDAHFDLRASDRPNSGTPFAQMADWCHVNDLKFRYFCLGISEASNTVALFDSARALGVEWREDIALGPWQLAEPLAALKAFIGTVDTVYLSIDLDVLPAAIMPAVSAPAALGVPLLSVETIINAVLATGKTAAVDVVELNPALDHDGLAARVAARIVWQIARNWPEKGA